jgi:hypothetical protein
VHHAAAYSRCGVLLADDQLGGAAKAGDNLH